MYKDIGSGAHLLLPTSRETAMAKRYAKNDAASIILANETVIILVKTIYPLVNQSPLPTI